MLLLEHLDAVRKPVRSTITQMHLNFTVHLLNSVDLKLSYSSEACSSTGMTPNVADIIRGWDKGGLLTGSREIRECRNFSGVCFFLQFDSLLLAQRRPIFLPDISVRIVVSGFPGHWSDRSEERWRQHHRLPARQQLWPDCQPCRPAVDGVWQQRLQNAQEWT